jgi:ribosomal protein L29
MADKKVKKAEEVKSIEQLRTDLQAKQADMLAARKSHAAGELVNPRVLTTTRKEIARLNTAIRALELSEKESN